MNREASLNGSPYRWQLAQAWGGYGQDFEMVIDDDDSYDYSGKFKIVSPVSMVRYCFFYSLWNLNLTGVCED